MRHCYSDLTAKEVRSALDYDPATGVFKWRSARANGAVPAGSIAGCLDANGYRKITIKDKPYVASRLAWLYVTGKWPKHFVDHVNGSPDDNRFENLRDATTSINAQNQAALPRQTQSGLLGVYIDRSRRRPRYFASITVDGKRTFLGYHPTKEDAHRAYVAAKLKAHPGVVPTRM